jgi:glutathione synthase/RimK-type ligase-like ATP-grasp enzyme
VILAVTHQGDDQAQPVLEALRARGAEVVMLDLADLPGRGRIAFSYGKGEERLILLDGREALDARRATAIWWRRPQPFTAAPDLSRAHAAFAVRQAEGALLGMLASLAPGVLFVNDPWREHLASQKTYQLAAALRAGLKVPETLVTSDPEAARDFLAPRKGGGAVHKAIQSTASDWRRTARVGAEDLLRLEDLCLAPVILQERVPGVDVRVTVVGEKQFAADIDARGSSSPDDYRGHEAECRVTPSRLPPAEEGALRALLRELGLVFATVDFRRRDDGDLLFLELNPAGQWGFVEERTGQEIGSALAERLLAGPLKGP